MRFDLRCLCRRLFGTVVCVGCRRWYVYVWTVVCFQSIVFQRVSCDCNTTPASGAQTNATTDRFADGTTLEYFCSTGYTILGQPVHRTCLGEDRWTEGPDKYNCQLKVTSIVTACACSVAIIIVFIVLVLCAVKRLRKPKKDIENVVKQEIDEPDIGQDNPYSTFANGEGEDDVNLDLFEMEQNGYVSEGTTDNNDESRSSTLHRRPEGEFTATRASTLPRNPAAELPELPANELRYCTLPIKPSHAGNGADSSNITDKNHIYDSIKHTPPELGQSMQINNEPFTRL